MMATAWLSKFSVITIDNRTFYFTIAAIIMQLLEVYKGDKGTEGIQKRKKGHTGCRH
jgi:hypothetical protein